MHRSPCTGSPSSGWRGRDATPRSRHFADPDRLHGVCARRRISPSPDVAFQEVEGEIILLDLSGERYWALDDVGTRCWQLLLEHGELDAAIDTLLAEFDVDEPTLRSDVEALVEQLCSAGLIVVAGPDGAA